MRILILFIIQLILIPLHGAEVDQFTFNSDKLTDSTKIINKYTNVLLKKAIRNANWKEDLLREGEGEELANRFNEGRCQKNILMTELTKLLISRTESYTLIPYIYYSKDVPRIDMHLQNTIYKKLTPNVSIILGLACYTKSYCAAGLIRIGEHVIGVDKIAHMLNIGKSLYIRQHDFLSAASHSLWTEKTFWGLWSTEVFSYSDLVANFNGMRLWNDMLKEKEDILGREIGPYIKCENNRWKVVNKIDLSNYIDHGFDESINCINLGSDKLTKIITKRINDQGMSCPRDKNILQKTYKKYNQYAPELINIDGIATYK